MNPYEIISQYDKFRRRHKANIFDSIFSDTEVLQAKDISEILQNVVNFFTLPVPQVKETDRTLAEIVTHEHAEDSELYYNLRMLVDNGINNKDALTLCLVHEMSHQILHQTTFMLFQNELWIQELAADLLCGTYADRYDIATGKYKFTLSRLKASPTHPPGKIREEIVEYGRNLKNSFLSLHKQFNVDDTLLALPAFVYCHMKDLSMCWKEIAAMDWNTFITNKPIEQTINIDDLPGSNLLKQYKLKHK
ncbi:MAG: hypothetical protein LKF31_02965 [Muribaculaceae bacterium]|jgi:hypothetical protein|nr:hypothetical protein [Muribaculaceae bacterium]